ncbi:hypothetical protein [Pedobacter heparinus]|uniref:Uncharacterized protein n=1 Tax=Pedobacter heparinus (strain ATCC 13125 / DSM 2366 / CIP 104194 / JCM 7457 / NBRC 12017 / NCIMB 9290 / NRRL B-14731 / HIM 762-3) TaxID=485917 RepID=C6Y3J8_PEDHD|nr:hypothetical protein [Pedobacter heparinus]ACU03277.1 hypothetical protein Phep_1058 [Pedobacter heparinus DSM 2366]
MKKTAIICLLFFISIKGISQTSLDQNGLKTTVTNTLLNSSLQAMRYEIAAVGFNPYHWQYGGSIIIELFHQYYASGYEKYSLGISYGSPALRLIESHGVMHTAMISLGTTSDLSTSTSGVINKVLPVYLDLQSYAGYKVRITYMQEKVDEVTDRNQIQTNTNPSGVIIPDFVVSTVLYNNIYSSGNLMLSGNGPHYIENGDVGIGTTDPKGYKLAVNGKIRAQEIKVEASPWPDYVFTKDYQLPTLQQTENHIKEKGHLPGIPSAEEVKANGIDLGEMNAKLLQKIEELTLHAIEQNRKIMNLEEIIGRNNLK